MDDEGNVETPLHPHTDPETLNWRRWEQVKQMMAEAYDDD